jgi:hypothetical protein
MDSFWAIIIGALGSLLAAELYLWLPDLADRLLRYNTAKLPPDLSIRLQEEWQTDLNNIPGHIAKFLFAPDLFRARWIIIREFTFSSNSFSNQQREEQLQETRTEENLLPLSVGWISTMNDPNYAAIQGHWQRQKDFYRFITPPGGGCPH